MLKYERHLVAVSVIAIVILVAAVLAIIFELPLPFAGKGG